MNALLDQLDLNQSFFVELGILAVLFFALSHLYFKPFLELFEARHRKTVEDKEASVRLMAQAQAKLEEYKRLLTEEKSRAKKEFEIALADVRKQESQLLATAREDAKKMTQEAIDSVNQQRDQLKKGLQADVEVIAQSITERFLSRKA